MKRVAAFGLVFVACAGLTVYKTADSWVFQSTKDNHRSAVEVRPTKGQKPTQHALAEIVWYRKDYNAGGYERFNISAMNDNEPMYRFGVERGNSTSDAHRPIWFCFERPEWEIGQPAYCPLRIDPEHGVLVCNKDQQCVALGEKP